MFYSWQRGISARAPCISVTEPFHAHIKLFSLIMTERKSFPLTASFVHPAKIWRGAAIQPRRVSRDAALQANASQRMTLKSNPVLTLLQSSDKTRSSHCLTRIRRKSRIESEMTASRGNGGESRGSGDSKSLKSKAQVEPQPSPEVVWRRRKLCGDTQPLNIRSLWINNKPHFFLAWTATFLSRFNY